jgi:hypothetical protein
MATIREYFDVDAKIFTVNTNWTIQTRTGETAADIIGKVAYDFEANAKYWYIYIPTTSDLSQCLNAIFRSPNVENCRIGPEGDGVLVDIGELDYSERLSSSTLQFTKRVHLYLDADLTPDIRTALVKEGLAHGYFLSIRDREYSKKRSESEKPLAFISHDSRDKDGFVRALATQLSMNHCTVWYDEYSLKVGDSLRANIERGLRETKKCIVILSPHFLSNEGWGKAEFDSIYTREIIEKQNVILPVWLDVGIHDIYKYSPRLADKVGLSASLGVEEVARQLTRAVKATL